MVSQLVGKKVVIILSNNFVYDGVVLDEDNFFIMLRDKFGKNVSLGKKDIQTIKEGSNNGY